MLRQLRSGIDRVKGQSVRHGAEGEHDRSAAAIALKHAATGRARRTHRGRGRQQKQARMKVSLFLCVRL
jgi:hypothetical protein